MGRPSDVGGRGLATTGFVLHMTQARSTTKSGEDDGQPTRRHGRTQPPERATQGRERRGVRSVTDAAAALVADRPALPDRQLPGDARTVPGAGVDHHPLYVLQAAGRRGECRRRHQHGRCDRGALQDGRHLSPRDVAGAEPRRTDVSVLRSTQGTHRPRVQNTAAGLCRLGARNAARGEGGAHRRPRREWLILVQAVGQLRPHAAVDRRVRVDQSPGGLRRRRAVRPRPQPRQALQRGAAEGHLRRRRRHRRGRERADRDRRLPEEPGQVPATRRHRAEGRVAGRCARHRQDAAGPGGRRDRRACRSSVSAPPSSSK